MQGDDVLQAIDRGQVLAGTAALQFVRQPCRTRCTGRKGLLTRLQPGVVGLQAGNARNDGFKVIAFAQRIDLRRVGQQWTGGGIAGMRLQQMGQAFVVVHGVMDQATCSSASNTALRRSSATCTSEPA